MRDDAQTRVDRPPEQHVRPLGSLIDRLLSDGDDRAVNEANQLVWKIVGSLSKSLPPLSGTAWNLAALEDLVNDVWAKNLVFRCANRVATDDDFAKVLRRSTKNMYLDRLRKEDDLPVHERVKDVLDNGPFISEADAYGLTGFEPGSRYQGSERDLERVADLEHLPLRYERPNAKKRGVFAHRPDMERVLTKIMVFAAAFVLFNSLVAIMNARMNRARSFVHVEWDFDDQPEPADTQGSQQGARLIAEEIWSSLTKDEKVALAYLDLPQREAAAKMRVKSATTAAKRIASARGTLAPQLAEAADLQADVMRELLRMHADHWTEPADAPLNEDEGHHQ